MAPLTIYPSRFIGVFTLKLALSMLAAKPHRWIRRERLYKIVP